MRAIFDPADLQVEEAKTISPDMLAKMIRRAEKPVLVTGGKLLEDEMLADLACEIAVRGKMEVVATGGSSKTFERFAGNRCDESGVKTVRPVTLHHFTQMVLDGLYDRRLLVFLGFEPYLLSRMLSSIRHFSKAVTVSIDPIYQPHARLSFPNCENYGLLETLVSFL